MPPDLQAQSRTAAKLFINLSTASIALYAAFFAFLLYSNRLYDVGRGWSSFVLLLLPAAEVLKYLYVQRTFQLDSTVKGVTPSGGAAGSSSSKASKGIPRWKEAFGHGTLLALSILFYGFICFVLGAPLEQFEETLSLAATLTSLTIFPITLFIGQAHTYRLLLSETLELKSPLANSYLNLLKNNCIGVVLGAWGASVVAPLDWDRPWQVYPIPNIVGSIGGLFGMNVFNLLSTAYMSAFGRKGLL